jgi:hypothetical protein
MSPADLKHRAVYRLTRDVKNPTPDRRRVRDFWALTEWKAGMLVRAFEDKHTNPRRPHWRLSTRKFYGDVCDTAEGGSFEALVAALEPERSLEATLYAARESTAIVFPEEILQLLIDEGPLTLEMIDAAVVVLIERNDADNAAASEATTGGLETKS